MFPTLTAKALDRTLAIVAAARAPAVLLAELRWERAQVDDGPIAERIALATTARAALAASHRDDLIASIDACVRAHQSATDIPPPPPR